MELMDSGELQTVLGRRLQGPLLRHNVEAYAVARFRARRYNGPNSYFVTTAGAAEVMSISRPRVIQLGNKGVIPFLARRCNGYRLYRRHQIELIANSRLARGHSHR
jgi:hypothetical protein